MKTQRRPQTDPSADSDAYQGLLRDLAAAIAPLQTLRQQAVETLAPMVREILRNRSRDTHLIEHTLDHLLDHACIPQGLACFKSLCRYYWRINPEATAGYIVAYREMWGSEADDGHETMGEWSRQGTVPTENASVVPPTLASEGELNLLAHAANLEGLGYGG